jgi:hypothetical protein
MRLFVAVFPSYFCRKKASVSAGPSPDGQEYQKFIRQTYGGLLNNFFCGFCAFRGQKHPE